MKHGTSTAATFVVLFVVVILLLVILLADAPSDKGPALDNEDKGTLAWQEDDRRPQKDPTADADADETQDGDEDEDDAVYLLMHVSFPEEYPLPSKNELAAIAKED